MAKVSAKGAVISVDDSGGTARDISSDCVSYSIEYNVDPFEVTGFGDGSRNFIAGQKVVGVTLEVLWNTASTTGAMTVLRSIIGSTTSKTVTITPEAGGLALSGEYMCEGIAPSGSSNGDAIKLGSVKFSVMGSTAPTWA